MDVYSDWVDACDAVQNGGPAETVRAGRAPAPLRTGGARQVEDDEDDLDGFVENDEPDMEAGFADE